MYTVVTGKYLFTYMKKILENATALDERSVLRNFIEPVTFVCCGLTY